MSFLQLCSLRKASRCPGFLVIILEACNLQILKGEEMAISSWAGSLLYATSYLLFKALLSTGMTGESRLRAEFSVWLEVWLSKYLTFPPTPKE